LKKSLIFLPLFLFSLNLSEILTHPKSYVRDFYLTEFMRETNSSTLAFKAYTSLYKVKLFKHTRLLAKFPEFKSLYKCVNVKKEYLREVDIACILNNGLSLRTISTLSTKDLIYLYMKLPKSIQKKAVKIFLTNDFSKVFSNRDLGYYFILNYPSKKIDQPIEDFSLFEDKYFYLFVKSAVVNHLNKIKHSLNKLDYKKFSDRVKWWLFLNAMTLNDKKRAFDILMSMQKSDKVNFWLWLITKKEGYLNNLLLRKRVNFYTLYAYEEAGKKFTNIKTNIIYNSIKKPLYNQTNPWDVLKFFNDLKYKNPYELAKKLDSNKSIALKAIALDKAFHYKYNFFITPDIYKDKNISFKAFVYAIARQESRFIPASVSRSYALGTMQIMPFLIRSYKSDVFKQFDYNENIRLGVKHLKWLFNNLHNPLMVAYAYNGGIGFVNRKIKPYFKYKGEFEPFLSMELIPYDESREYGKRVLANFVIYSHIFGDNNLTLHKLLKK